MTFRKMAQKITFAACKSVLMIAVGTLSLSCSSTQSGGSMVRYQGHYTQGSGPVIFVPQTTPDKKLLCLLGDTPREIIDFLKTQPEHPDVTRESESSVSAFADVLGQVVYAPDGTARFKASKVFSVGPAKKDYSDSWGKWPPPATFEKRD
jgi:hypothetical protein